MPYSSMEDVNPALRGIEPPVTLSQANAIAAVADGIPKDEVDNPWAVAISSFKKSHKVEDGKWVKKEDSEFGKKESVLSTVVNSMIGALKQLVTGTDQAVIDNQDSDGEVMNTGVKAISTDAGKYVVLWTSNTFKDSEGETFTTQAWNDYVKRADKSGNRGRLWFWHVKGSDYADIVWQGMVDHMLVEVAKIDDTPRGQHMFDALQNPGNYPGLLPVGWGTSHGYLYGAKHRQSDGTYHFVHKFESTTLPLHRASNVYGKVMEVIDMTKELSDEKLAALKELLGEEEATNVIAAAKAASAALERAGVSFKEVVGGKFPPDDTEEEDEEDEEDEEETTPSASDEEAKKVPAGKKGDDDDEGLFEMELSEELISEIAAAVDVTAQVEKAVKEAMVPLKADIIKAVQDAVIATTVASKEAVVKEALAGRINLVPFTASKSKDNVVSGVEIKKEEKSAGAGGDAIVAAVVSRMLGN